MAQYYLAVGTASKAEKLRDCESDQIELAEYEAVVELKKQRAQGNEDAIVRVVEEGTKLVVFTVHKDNVDKL